MRPDLASIAILVLATTSLACGPIGPIPGGQLSGQVAAAAPADWSSSDSVDNVQLETRPSDPYSVNIWGVGVGDRFYVASGRGAENAWAQYIQEDPNVRLRVGETIYELRAVRVSDDESRTAFLDAVKRKYDWEPDEEQSDEAWLFRLEPR